jgi:hypothetical protein
MQVMRNMVGYIIVAHKLDDKGKYKWFTEVTITFNIYREKLNI